MLEVTLNEPTRKFFLSVGELQVGHVLVYPWGTCCAYNKEGGWVTACSTLSQAAQQILEGAGYGRAKDVKVKRIRRAQK